MEENQVEVLPENKPAEEPKRPLLLSIILIISILGLVLFFIIGMYYLFRLHDYRPIRFYLFGITFLEIYVCVKLWRGFKWARVVYLIIGLCAICGFIISSLKAFLETIKDAHIHAFTNKDINIMMSVLISSIIILLVLMIFVLLYIFLDKNVKTYCRK